MAKRKATIHSDSDDQVGQPNDTTLRSHIELSAGRNGRISRLDAVLEYPHVKKLKTESTIVQPSMKRRTALDHDDDLAQHRPHAKSTKLDDATDLATRKRAKSSTTINRHARFEETQTDTVAELTSNKGGQPSTPDGHPRHSRANLIENGTTTAVTRRFSCKKRMADRAHDIVDHLVDESTRIYNLNVLHIPVSTKLAYDPSILTLIRNDPLLKILNNSIATEDSVNKLKTLKIAYSPLMALPGEIRNEIYRLALVEEHTITVDANSHTQPGLLMTSKQIRKEAESIYLQENNFKTIINNFKLEPHPAHWSWPPRASPVLEFHGPASWSNFKEWAKILWESRIRGKYCPDLMTTSFPWGASIPGAIAVGSVFQIVKTLARPSVDWETVEDVLESSKLAIESQGQFAWSA